MQAADRSCRWHQHSSQNMWRYVISGATKSLKWKLIHACQIGSSSKQQTQLKLAVRPVIQKFLCQMCRILQVMLVANLKQLSHLWKPDAGMAVNLARMRLGGNISSRRSCIRHPRAKRTASRCLCLAIGWHANMCLSSTSRTGPASAGCVSVAAVSLRLVALSILVEPHYKQFWSEVRTW